MPLGIAPGDVSIGVGDELDLSSLRATADPKGASRISARPRKIKTSGARGMRAGNKLGHVKNASRFCEFILPRKLSKQINGRADTSGVKTFVHAANSTGFGCHEIGFFIVERANHFEPMAFARLRLVRFGAINRNVFMKNPPIRKAGVINAANARLRSDSVWKSNSD